MTASAPTRLRQSPSPVPTYLIKEQLELALLLWIGVTIVVGIVIEVVSFSREIEISGWDQATQIARWYVLFIGVHVGGSVLPLHVTHGQTRRDFMRQATIFVAVFAAGVSVLVTASFVLEAGLYRLADWPQAVESGQLYGSAMELHLVFVQSWLLTALWGAGGALIAAAWYRDAALGGFAIVLAGVSGISMSSDWGPFGAIYEHLFGEDSIGGGVGVAIHLALIALVLGLMWQVVREIPIKNKQA